MSEAQAEAILLAVVAEDTATAMLYRRGDGFTLETIVWPAMWGTRSRFVRSLTPDEARAWVVGHGVDIAMEVET